MCSALKSNIYTYVGNNPLRFVDPFGLTQNDIDVARAIAKETQPDLRFPDNYATENLGEIAAKTLPQVETVLNSKYLLPLSNKEAADLLDTIIHEAVHYSYPLNDSRQIENDRTRTGYAYDQAKQRTTKDLVKLFNKERALICK